VIAPVVILDPAAAFRRGLAASLTSADFRPEEQADLWSWAVRPGRKVILVTVRVPSGWGPLLALTRLFGKVLVIALLKDAAPEAYSEALRIGADGVADWHAEPEFIVEVVQAAYNGHLLIPLPAGRALARGHEVVNKNSISPDEREWLTWMASGMSVCQMAARAGYSERAFYRRLAALYKRIGAAGRTEALIYAIEHGILRQPHTVDDCGFRLQADGTACLAYPQALDEGHDRDNAGRAFAGA
jgi:DNA-binding NarL/FixJ family response regulator